MDISELIYKFPQILLFDEIKLNEKYNDIKNVMNGSPEKTQTLIYKEPHYFNADVNRVLGEVKRLMPMGNPPDVLLAMPEKFLIMEELGLESCADLEASEKP